MLNYKPIFQLVTLIAIGSIFSSIAYSDVMGVFQPPKTYEESVRQNTINAPLIILCTNISGLDNEIIDNFVRAVFAETSAPLVVSGNYSSQIHPSGTVYFYFDLFEKNSHRQWNEACLSQFPLQPNSYSEILDGMSQNLGQVPSFLPNAALYEPIAMKLKTIVGRNNVVFLVLGNAEADLPIVKLGLLELFGLSPDFCEFRNLCPENLNVN